MANYHVFRVKEDTEIMGEIAAYCEEHNIDSGILLGMIGSLNHVKLSFIKSVPGNYITEEYTGPLEIVAAQGSIAREVDGDRIIHIHMVISDKEGAVGGHFSEGTTFTTAEVVILEFEVDEPELKRQLDDYTGLKELVK